MNTEKGAMSPEVRALTTEEVDHVAGGWVFNMGLFLLAGGDEGCLYASVKIPLVGSASASTSGCL